MLTKDPSRNRLTVTEDASTQDTYPMTKQPRICEKKKDELRWLLFFFDEMRESWPWSKIVRKSNCRKNLIKYVSNWTKFRRFCPGLRKLFVFVFQSAPPCASFLINQILMLKSVIRPSSQVLESFVVLQIGSFTLQNICVIGHCLRRICFLRPALNKPPGRRSGAIWQSKTFDSGNICQTVGETPPKNICMTPEEKLFRKMELLQFRRYFLSNFLFYARSHARRRNHPIISKPTLPKLN